MTHVFLMYYFYYKKIKMLEGAPATGENCSTSTHTLPNELFFKTSHEAPFHNLPKKAMSTGKATV